MKRKKCYISGKITGLNVIAYTTKFKASERLVSILGYAPINPLEHGLGEGHLWATYMFFDIIIMLRCRAIFFQKDWRDSKGARIEYRIAKILRLKMYFER